MADGEWWMVEEGGETASAYAKAMADKGEGGDGLGNGQWLMVEGTSPPFGRAQGKLRAPRNSSGQAPTQRAQRFYREGMLIGADGGVMRGTGETAGAISRQR
jgi:hypothetical protein